MVEDKNTEALFLLVKAGLFPVHDEGFMVHDSLFKDVDWGEVYRLAEEQSVIGLVAAGLEELRTNNAELRVPQEWAFQFIGQTLQMEQRNKAMNEFIGELIQKLRKADIYTLMVKGQGVAQCYEKPLWRVSGDIDLYLSEENFKKAKTFFRPLVPCFDPDNEYTRHINMTLEPWVVEIHGNQYTYISSGIDRVLDEIHKDLFYGGDVRSWQNGRTTVFLPSPDNDVLIVFTHFIKHFFKGGLGLRQICDWARLLWTYRSEIDLRKLEKRLKKMGLMTEWKAFGAVVVDILGMPVDAMPFYSDSAKWKKKAEKILDFVLEVGNFGHNRDSNYMKYPYVIRKCFSMGRRIGDLINHARIFPLDSLRFFPRIMFNGIISAVRGE